MAQVKVYGLKSELNEIRGRLSETIHSCVVDALDYPPEKRFHRFFPMDSEDFVHPPDRSDRYIIIEISMFEGRSFTGEGSSDEPPPRENQPQFRDHSPGR